MKRFNFAKMQSFVWRAALTMLFFVMITSHFTFGFAAKYTSGASDSDSARVAKFSVSVNNADLSTMKELNFSAATDYESMYWSFTVSNNSEVASEEKVVITLNEALPTWLTMTATMNEEVYAPTISGNTYTYVTTFSAGVVDHNWVITFTGHPDTAIYTTITGSVSVSVTQID